VVEIDGVLTGGNEMVGQAHWSAEIATALVSVYGPGIGRAYHLVFGFLSRRHRDAKTGLAQKVFVLTELQEIFRRLTASPI